MSPETLLSIGDHVGVFVFALSGGIVAVRHGMDLFGCLVLAFLPAAGGGTLRDLILDVPVFWLDDPTALYLAAAGGLTAFFLTSRLERFRPLRWADAAGLALFAVTGAAKAHGLGHGFTTIVVMGVMTATAGGVIRDVVANRVPLLLKEEVYATAALLGAGVYAALTALGVDERSAILAGLVSGFALRAIAIVLELSLPRSRG